MLPPNLDISDNFRTDPPRTLHRIHRIHMIPQPSQDEKLPPEQLESCLLCLDSLDTVRCPTVRRFADLSWTMDQGAGPDLGPSSQRNWSWKPWEVMGSHGKSWIF